MRTECTSWWRLWRTGRSLIGVRTPALGGAARSLRGRGRGRHRISAQHGRLRHHRRRRHLYAHGRACASRAGTQAFEPSSALAVGAMRDAPPRLRPRARTRGRSYLRRRDALAGRRLVVHDPRAGRGLLYSAHVQPLGVRAHAKSARDSGGARGERGRRSERTHQRPEDVVEGDAQLLLLQPRLAARP